MAELHLIGELVGGSGFPSGNLFCKWGLATGSAWKVLEGLQEGQTQVDHPQVSGTSLLTVCAWWDHTCRSSIRYVRRPCLVRLDGHHFYHTGLKWNQKPSQVCAVIVYYNNKTPFICLDHIWLTIYQN